MAINVLNAIDEAGPQYNSAFVFTYTLNLRFFEQLVEPRLKAAGCANVLILADSHGYSEALAHNTRDLDGVGCRYVCAPMRSPGTKVSPREQGGRAGVQHAKCILLVGRRQGRLLVGSGNLTLSGYGGNLELFSVFDLAFDETGVLQSSREDAHAFAVVWDLLGRLHRHAGLTLAALGKLEVAEEVAPWLREIAATQSAPGDFRLLHNLERPILELLPDVPRSNPLQRLEIISPYFDLHTLEALVRKYRPKSLLVGTDPLRHTLDGAGLARRCAEWGVALEIGVFEALDARRPLHAKAIVGVSLGGAWCLSGSANCTRPALRSTWLEGGNLEMVTWRWSPDATVFESLWNDELFRIEQRLPDSVCYSVEEPEGNEADKIAVYISDLRVEGKVLEGRVVGTDALPIMDELPRPTIWSLELLNHGSETVVQLEGDGRFRAKLPDKLQGIEAGRLLGRRGGLVVAISPYHWVDQPAELTRYGNRAYHERVTESLKTFDGSEKLFHELLNMLLKKVDPRTIGRTFGKVAQPPASISMRLPAGVGSDDMVSSIDDAEEGETNSPSPEEFITEEILVTHLSRHAETFLVPQRSTFSLRGLLSLVLMRLTTPTEIVTVDVTYGEDRNEEEDSRRIEDWETKRMAVLRNLRAYLLGYCESYSRYLTNKEWVCEANPSRVLENHFTLGRVLIEFVRSSEATDIFTKSDLQRCARLLFGSLFWPKLADLAHGRGTWELFLECGYDSENLRIVWDENLMPVMSVEIMTEAWGQAPSWERAIHDEELVKSYLRAQVLIKQMERYLGVEFWKAAASQRILAEEVQGFRHPRELQSRQRRIYPITQRIKAFDTLANYRTPVEEKYASLIAWWETGQSPSPTDGHPIENAVNTFNPTQYGEEILLLRSLLPGARITALEGTTDYCPGCRLVLPSRTITRLRRGNLVACNCRKRALFWKPTLNL